MASCSGRGLVSRSQKGESRMLAMHARRSQSSDACTVWRVCADAVQRFRGLSSNEGQSHLYKGRQLNFEGYRCFVAPAPAHVAGGPPIAHADGVSVQIIAPPPSRASHLLRSLAHQMPPIYWYCYAKMTRPICSDASIVSPGDSHLDQVLPQASRFISPHLSLTHIKLLAHPAAVKRNTCRRRLCAAVRESESSMIRSGRAHQLWSHANVNKALPPHPMYAHARACGASKPTSDAACARASTPTPPAVPIS